MEKFSIYCKSYRGDLERVKVLAESIEQYNIENIPFYISCPKSDYDLFRKSLSNNINLIIDEDIVQKNYDENWKSQQIIKCLSFLCQLRSTD